jgi:putative membrane protein
VRTAFSSEQTLMSWVRTSVSLFTFGVAITQCFYYLTTQQGGTQLPAGPRRLGLALIGVGVVALVLAIAEHVARLRKMREQGLQNISGFLLPIGSAVVLLAIGIAALVFVTLNRPL